MSSGVVQLRPCMVEAENIGAFGCGIVPVQVLYMEGKRQPGTSPRSKLQD